MKPVYNFNSSSSLSTNGISINEAYKFETQSEFIKTLKNNIYILNCIFCSSQNTIPLMNDGGSFRQCNNCKKNFRAKIK